MSAIDFINDHIKNIQSCNSAIIGLADLVIQFQFDSEGDNEIPAKVKSPLVIGAIHTAISILANESERSIEWIERELQRGQS